ncbi:MAG: hypothetical protein IJ237_04525 [Oscillospiraceae bacterium]|nr:hypothetical protein [Oscillospiraceae bacterium]
MKFSELTKSVVEIILYHVKSLGERFADNGKQTLQHDDACYAHVDVHVHDASRLWLQPVSFIIQFGSFRIPDREASAGIPVFIFEKEC